MTGLDKCKRRYMRLSALSDSEVRVSLKVESAEESGSRESILLNHQWGLLYMGVVTFTTV